MAEEWREHKLALQQLTAAARKVAYLDYVIVVRRLGVVHVFVRLPSPRVFPLAPPTRLVVRIDARLLDRVRRCVYSRPAFHVK